MVGVPYEIAPKLSMGQVKPNYLMHGARAFIKATNAGSPSRALLQGRLWRLGCLLLAVFLSLSILPAPRCRRVPLPPRAVGSIPAGSIHAWGWAPPATAPVSLRPRQHLVPDFLGWDSASDALPQGVPPLLLVLVAV